MIPALGAISFSGHQFIRAYRLSVAKTGETEIDTTVLDLSELRFSFRVRQGDIETPNTMVCRIYNLSADTANTLISEYDQVNLECGYSNAAVGVIFSGSIKRYRKGRDNNTETFLQIEAADLDLGYNFGFVSKTHGPGSTYADVLKACAAAMNAKADPASVNLAQFGGTFPRGRVQYGLAKIEMRTVAASLNASWHIRNGTLYLTKITSYLPGTAIVLTPQTGLAGYPEQTEDGIEARAFLNPLLTIGALVQIAPEYISNQQSVINQTLPFNGAAQSQVYPATITQTGLYKVLVCDHTGDTRGAEWYSDIVCLAVDNSGPSGKSVAPFP